MTFYINSVLYAGMNAAVYVGQRKTQNIGGSAFVNLPKIWIENAGVCKGDDLSFQILEDGSLRVFYEGGQSIHGKF